MLEYNLERAKKALQYLVDSSYFAHHLKKLRSAVQKPRALPFKDDAECLNEILIIGRQNLQSMENMIAIAEHKRDDHNGKQRMFMAAKRQREAKAIAVDEALLGRKMTLDERLAALHKQHDVWNKERAQFLESKGEMDFATKCAEIKFFWQVKEAELDELLLEAQKMEKTVARKKVVVVEDRDPKSLIGFKLKEAMAARVNSMHKKGRLSIDKVRQ